MTEEKVQETVQKDALIGKEAEPSISPELAEAIAESKKYRQRAQKVESQLEEMNKQVEADRQTQLEKNEQWKTLADERQALIEEQAPILEEFKAREAKRREELLSVFSDEDREKFKGLSSEQLEVIQDKLNSKANTSSPTPLGRANPKINSDWTEMNVGDKRKNWNNIIKSYKN